jgi:biopolymer transport protein ExbD
LAFALARRERVSLAPAAEPNVIPFIDVLLVLLIIFMVTAPKPTTDLRVDLPVPGGHPIQIEIPPTVVMLRYAPEGVRYFVGAEETPREHLAERALAQMLAVDPSITANHALAEGRLFVRSDLDVAYANVVSAVEDLQAARFRKVAIVAQDADSEP